MKGSLVMVSIEALALALFLGIPASPVPEARIVLSPERYELSFDVDYAAEILRATARIVVANPSATPVRQASFLLYRLLRVRSARDGHGSSLAFTQSVVAFEDVGKLQVNQVLVTLGEPLAPGASAVVEIQYDGHLLGYAETGMLYVKDRIDPEFTILREDAYAYPQPGYPSRASRRATATMRRFTYSARVTVPRGLVVANGGRLEGTDAAGDRVTFRFSSLKPSWRMDFAIAKYGELSSGSVRIYYLQGDAAGAAAVAEAARKALDLFGRWFGPLPQKSALTFIEIPDGWGSQTDVTTIIQTAAAFRDPRQHREVFHEISHLWNPPDKDPAPPRWNEGLATFLEYLVDQEVSGQPAIDQRAARLIAWLREALPKRPELRNVALVDYGRNEMANFSYSVGALFFDLLYRLSGRENFNRTIREYVAGFFTLGGSTNDFVATARKNSGADLSRLYTDWIYTTGWVNRIENGAGIEDLVAYYSGRGKQE